jgi:hypothetical protein
LATTVYTIEEVALQDDSKVQLKPLNIKTLRQFMKVMEDFGDPDKTEQESFEILLNASAICLKKERPEFWDDSKSEHTEEFEDVADIPTIYKILDVCGGIKLNDPNLIAAATEALGKS